MSATPSSEGERADKIDPSSLTTAQLVRELTWLRELLEVRLSGMDKAVVLLNDNVTRVPTDTDKQIQHLKELHSEKFESIQVQFKERDTRSEQTSKDSKVAVEAALQAAKEAVGEQNRSSAMAIAKSEAATTKQLDQITALISTAGKSSDEKINDLKARLDRGEGRSTGAGDTIGYVVGGIGVVSTLIAIFISISSLKAPVQQQPALYVPAPAGATVPAAPTTQIVR